MSAVSVPSVIEDFWNKSQKPFRFDRKMTELPSRTTTLLLRFADRGTTSTRMA